MTDTALDRNFKHQCAGRRLLSPVLRGACRWQTAWLERLRAVSLLALLAIPGPAWAEALAKDLVFLVQSPVWGPSSTPFDAQPFAARLSATLGQPVQVRRSEDVLSHWRTVHSGRGFDLAFDEAHFTAYRVSHHGFAVLAQAESEVRFAVVVRPRTLITAPSDLSARKVAAPAPPALAALRLLNLFPDAVHVPVLVTVTGREQALRALAVGEVSAAILPMAVAETRDGVQIALETDASPGRAFSVSSAISPTQRRDLLGLFRELNADAQGHDALSGLGISQLQPVTSGVYEDAEQLLKGIWGY